MAALGRCGWFDGRLDLRDYLAFVLSNAGHVACGISTKPPRKLAIWLFVTWLKRLKPEHLSSPSHEAPAEAGASPAPRRRSTARSIWRRLTLSLGFRRFHPPHEIVDKARERTLERFAPVANRLAFGR
jgi:hypothetical protein